MAGSSRNFQANLILGATDAMSGVVARATSKSLNSFQSMAAKWNAGADKMFGIGTKSAVMGAAVAAPLVFATKKALDFEDAMAAVSKVTNIAVGSTGFDTLSEEVKDLSVFLGRSATESAGLYANLAQGGIARADLAEVGKIAGAVGVAFGIAGEEAGDAFSKVQNALGGTVGETELLMDAINTLSDRTSAKAPEILKFLSSGGAGVARGYGVQGQEIAALGSALIGVGKSGEEAATIVERFAKGAMRDVGMRRIFQGAGGGMKGFQAILEAGAKLGAGEKQIKFFNAFGEYGNDVRLLAQNMGGKGGLSESLGFVATEAEYAGSAMAEFMNRNSTGLGQLRVKFAEFDRTVIDAGNNMVPAFKEVLAEISPMLKAFGEYVKSNPETVKNIALGVAGFAGLALVISGAAFAIGTFLKIGAGLAWFGGLFATGGALSLVTPWLYALPFVLGNAAKAAWLFLAPFALTAAVFVAIGAALVLAYMKIEPFHKAVVRLGEALRSTFDHLPDFFGKLLSGDWKGAVEVQQKATRQVDMNVDMHMKEWRSERAGGYDKPIYGIQGQETAGVSGLFSPILNAPAPKKVIDQSNNRNLAMPFRTARTETQSGDKTQPIVINSNPTFNLPAGSADMQKDMFQMIEKNNTELMRQIDEMNRRKERVQLK